MSQNIEAIAFEGITDQEDRLSWQALLCTDRLHPRAPNHSQDRTEFEIDHDRLIFSKAFRRLARKTQVHPLATNDHTHNRLTHSLEVAAVGRSLGKAAFRIAQQSEYDQIPATAYDFAELVQAACLAHDVGNTPFGHAGERAIRHWMNQHPRVHRAFTTAQQTDLKLYEGNAQAFRIATRSVSGFEEGCENRQGGLGLTAATLAVMIKYPWYSDHEYAQAEGKYSVFQSDAKAFDWVVNNTGLLFKEDAYCRHPLAFLVEAADDICNAVIDIEDAIDLHILDRSDVENGLMQLSELTPSATIKRMRAAAISTLVEQCISVFNTNYDAIMHGDYHHALIEGIDADKLTAFNNLNSIARNKVYPFQQDDSLEANCQTLLGDILNAAINRESILRREEDDIIMAPFVEYLNNIQQTSTSEYEQLMMLMDFIAGMTDNYAANLAGRLR